MSKSSIYEDKEFWYKLDVDYDKAKEILAEIKEQQKEDDREEEIDDISDILLRRFERRKGAAIESQYKDVAAFRETIKKSTPEEAKKAFTGVYVEYIWIQNDRGEVFDSEEATIDEVKSIADDDRLVREPVDDEFDILWPGKAEIGREIQDGEVSARKFYDTTPIVLRKEGNTYEIRGRKKDRKRVVKRFRNSDEFEEREPDYASEPVVSKLQALMQEDNDEFQITGVDFSESELPEKSRLRVKNDRAVYRDLQDLQDRNLISMAGISEVSKLYLQDLRLGGKFRIAVKHAVEGVQFELEASHKTDRHRKQFKQSFTDITGIEFDTVYEYGSEDERYLFNKILAENTTAYDSYYDDLDDDLQAVLDGDAGPTGGELLTVDEEERKTCEECSTEVLASTEECDECQSRDFTEPGEQTTLEVNETSVATYLQNRLESVTPEHPKLNINGWSIEDQQMANRKVLRCEFTLTEIENRSNTSSHQTIYLIPYGNMRRPSTVNDYLLKSIYLTYGPSESNNEDGYGYLSLYDVITTDNLAKLVGNAVHDAILGLRDRVHSKSLEANEEASDYFTIVDEDGPIHEAKDQLEDIYNPSSPNYFEKHLFYLFKEMFQYSERWGRIGEAESDGVLICPRGESDEYYVGTYDAKLSHAKGGYDLGAEEEDQATRYMLTEDEREAIQNLTGDGGLSAHLLISQNFSNDKSDFARIAGNVQEDIMTYTGESGPKFVFMEFRAVLKLFEMYQRFWRAIRNSGVRKKFDQFVVEELETEETVNGESFVHFNDDSVSNIREKLISRVDDYDLEELNEYSA
jgi:hypothetical protein